MASLKLFGSPSLQTDAAGPLTGRAVQRHRLALLALLAIAGPRGVSRDTLIAQLWPEGDPERARNLLSVSVYVLRAAMGEDALLSEGNDLRLNPDRVTVDVAAFEAAVQAGDPATAVGLYRAPFLDGFFLPDAVGFERWTEGERHRFADAAAGALEALAEAAEAQREFPRAAEWWKRRAAHDPYDSRVALRLMQALEASGHRSGAMQHASVHRRLLEVEFGVEPDPEVLAFAERLRNGRLHAAGEEAVQDRSITIPAHQTPTPIAPGPQGAASQPVRSERLPGRRRHLALLYGIVTLIVGTAIVFIPLWFSEKRPASAAGTELSIGVLPMMNLSSDPDDAALATGMTEALVAMLWKTENLRVILGTPASAIDDPRLDARQIAASLGVSSLVLGSVQKIGTRVRVRVLLVNGSDGSAGWSETYDREVADVFAMQDEIGRAVASELGVRLVGVAGTASTAGRPRSIAAYELYLRGAERVLLRSDSGARVGVALLREAIALDSTYAAAWAGLAIMYGRVGQGVPMPDRARYYALAEEAAVRSIALDDSLADGHATLGVVRMTSLDFTSAERHLVRAIALDPTRPLIHEWMVTLYLSTGRPQEALAHARRALELDPLSPYAHAETARALLGNDRCDEALELLEALAGLRPPMPRSAFLAAHCYGHKEMWAEAIAALRPAAEGGEPHSLAHLGYFLGRAGLRDEALENLASVVEGAHVGGGGAYEVALVYAGLGDLDETFAWLDRSLQDLSLTGTPGKPTHLLLSGPIFEELRRDPRFEALRRRIGSG